MKILIVYHSITGNVQILAKAIAEGAEKAGAEVRLRRVRSLKLETESLQQSAEETLASTEDLKWADGVALGSPSYLGTIAAELKAFLDSTRELWLTGDLAGKPACVFTSTAAQHGGQETALLSMMLPLFHLGFTVIGLPYSEQLLLKMDYVHGGSPYGVSSVSGPETGIRPTAIDLKLARTLGHKLATTAQLLKGKKLVSAAA
jgi:NAD(P)H dehydrogenase (quinone)